MLGFMLVHCPLLACFRRNGEGGRHRETYSFGKDQGVMYKSVQTCPQTMFVRVIVQERGFGGVVEQVRGPYILMILVTNDGRFEAVKGEDISNRLRVGILDKSIN